jgi:hypothetical protein
VRKFNEGWSRRSTSRATVAVVLKRASRHPRASRSVPPCAKAAGRPAAPDGVRRPGPAEDDRGGLHRDAQQRELSFALCPLLTDGAIEALPDRRHAEQQSAVPAEDDLRRVDRHDEPDRAAGRLRPRARCARGRAAADGSYKIFGTKIFITYGEHDMAENIVHLVLAACDGAPEA